MEIKFIDGRIYRPTKIIGVGRNYSEHIREMNAQLPQEPVLFIKPSTALCKIEEPIAIPVNRGNVHHEVELAVCIGEECKNVSEAEAEKHIAGYGLALDLTLRDIQAVAKKKGTPWAIAKGFDGSCPVSQFFSFEDVNLLQNIELSLTVNSVLKQEGNTSQMIFNVTNLISYISGIFTLLPGDLILTGTPSGVGPLVPGDKINVRLDGKINIDTIITAIAAA